MTNLSAERIAEIEAKWQTAKRMQKLIKEDDKAVVVNTQKGVDKTNNSSRIQLATSEQVVARAKREAITCQPNSELAKARQALARYAQGKQALADYEARLAEDKARKAEEKRCDCKICKSEKVEGYVAHKTYLARDYKDKAQQMYKHVHRVLEIIDGKRVWKVKYAY